MANSTSRRPVRNHQSAKPRPDFPLTAHPSGRWCKKVRGKIHYFGPIDKPDEAVALWLEQKDALLAGLTPRAKRPAGLVLADIVNAYLTHKQDLLRSGELSTRTYETDYRTCASMIAHFRRDRLIDDLLPEDFAGYRAELSKTLSPVSLGNAIQRTRSVFKFAYESGMLKTPVVFGPGFKRPSKKTLRLERAKKGTMLFERAELLALLEKASVPMRAMLLLAINAGLGNSDLASMPLASINLATGWVNYPRPKTGIPRHFPLWPETLASLREAIDKRPKPKEKADEGLVFITKYGARWSKAVFEEIEGEPGAFRNYMDNAIGKEFAKLLRAAKIEVRKGRSFYTCRHVFETIAGESRDQVAVDHVMGHARDDMASVYRERISDERLSAVVEHVRTWLFGKGGAA